MRVIPDKDVNEILDSLTFKDLTLFQNVLCGALIKYHVDPSRIPERIVMNRDDLDAVHIFMPSFADRVGIKTLGGSKEGFKGAVSILNENNGELLGVLNALTLTPFRTALASSLALMRFVDEKIENQEITVFGNGPQAYWHVKLTLLFYPRLFKTVQVSVREVNDKTNKLINTLKKEFPGLEFEAITHAETELAKSHVIYGCIPSTEPNIKYAQLNKERPTFISLIGSYKPHMFECDDEIVQHALSNGKIIVDSKEHTLHESGELIKNHVKPENCVELGELDPHFSNDDITTSNKLVLCKIVGLSIMDISVGTEILRQALEKNLGTDVEF